MTNSRKKNKLQCDSEATIQADCLSRSQLYAVALQEYLQLHKPDQITQQLDAVYADEDSSIDKLFVSLQNHSLKYKL